MALPSIAAKALKTIEEILPSVRELSLLAGPNGAMDFEIVISNLSSLEEACRTRVEANVYEAHRRVLEACHVSRHVPEQGRRVEP